jgi:adenine-specific DNA-methyltransferase
LNVFTSTLESLKKGSTTMLDTKTIPYLSQQLPAYIGNKRSLLGFLREVFLQLSQGFDQNKAQLRFFDGFAGTGAVSRLAKFMGFSVYSNDWEHYSWIMNSAFLKANQDFKSIGFLNRGGFKKVLDLLNDPSIFPVEDISYLETYYAPINTLHTDYRKERLFYSRENAGFLDRTRQLIEEWYPGWELEPQQLLEKQLLLSLVIYQAATHANTSGVFKAYHKGFGGHSGDALKRILSPMSLIEPELWPGRADYEVWNEDVLKAARRQSFDLVYLDPPYNIHQYGSNYFMLNTISKWDQPDPQFHLVDGKLSVKAGIREDWKETWSPFCSKKTAVGAMEDLFNTLDAPIIALSYNTEGIVAFDELVDLMAQQGAVSIQSQDYITYRGGRQSPSRKISNMEMVLVLDRTKKQTSSHRTKLDSFVIQKKLAALENSYVNMDRLFQNFPSIKGKFQEKKTSSEVRRTIRVPLLSRTVELEMKYDCYIDSVQADLERLANFKEEKIREFWKEILQCLPQSHQERVEIILSMMKKKLENIEDPASLDKKDQKFYQQQAKHMLWSLRKFAHKKYQEDFDRSQGAIGKFFRSYPLLFSNLEANLDELRSLAYSRISG